MDPGVWRTWGNSPWVTTPFTLLIWSCGGNEAVIWTSPVHGWGGWRGGEGDTKREREGVDRGAVIQTLPYITSWLVEGRSGCLQSVRQQLLCSAVVSCLSGALSATRAFADSFVWTDVGWPLLDTLLSLSLSLLVTLGYYSGFMLMSTSGWIVEWQTSQHLGFGYCINAQFQTTICWFVKSIWPFRSLWLCLGLLMLLNHWIRYGNSWIYS